jgi:hypothetical protein
VTSIRRAGRDIPQVCAKTFSNGIVLLEILQAVKDLGRALQSRTLLFFGCSLAKDRTMHALAEVLRQASGLEHFAIIEKPASDDAFFAKQQSLWNCGVLPIWYPTGRHDLIEPLIRWIASLQPARKTAGPDPVLERTSQRKSEVRSELDLAGSPR